MKMLIILATVIFANSASAQEKIWLCTAEDGSSKRVSEKDIFGYCEPEINGAKFNILAPTKTKSQTKQDAANRKRMVAKGEESIRNMLKDPYSSKFRNTRVSADNLYFCGEVNAKNAMGGYVGHKKFFTNLSTGLGVIEGDEDFSMYSYGQKCTD